MVGTWPGLINEGMVLVSDQWKKELFARWPECALRSYLSSTHGIPLEHQAILIDECRIVPLPAQNDLSAWVEFANLARTTPFPYTFDIVQLLLTRPDPKELFLAICEHAEAEKESGPWSAYVHTFTEEECSRSQPLFEKYATLLWSSFFSLLEAK